MAKRTELTADEIAAEREKLVKKILAKDKLLADITKIKETLKLDFEEREMEYPSSAQPQSDTQKYEN